MVKCFGQVAVGFVPSAGAEVNLGEFRGSAETLTQQIAKEMVIAIPAPLLVERDDEQVGAFEVFQSLLCGYGSVAQYGFAERGAQTVENGCAQQESLYMFWLALEDFFEQVIEHKAVTAGEGLNESGCVSRSVPLHGQGCQLQTGNPALGALLQPGDIALGEIQSHHPVEEIGGFGGGEAQVGGTQFGELIAHPQTCQRQGRVFAAGDDQAQLRRLVFDEEGQGFVNRFGVEQVVIVEDENQIIGQG